MTPKSHKSAKSAKSDRILRGLQDLCDRQQPGQSFSSEEIAAHCTCSPQAIEQIEWKARERMRQKLRSIAGELGLTVPKA